MAESSYHFPGLGGTPHHHCQPAARATQERQENLQGHLAPGSGNCAAPGLEAMLPTCPRLPPFLPLSPWRLGISLTLQSFALPVTTSLLPTDTACAANEKECGSLASFFSRANSELLLDSSYSSAGEMCSPDSLAL